jgi:hypothetical protein
VGLEGLNYHHQLREGAGGRNGGAGAPLASRRQVAVSGKASVGGETLGPPAR